MSLELLDWLLEHVGRPIAIIGIHDSKMSDIRSTGSTLRSIQCGLSGLRSTRIDLHFVCWSSVLSGRGRIVRWCQSCTPTLCWAQIDRQQSRSPILDFYAIDCQVDPDFHSFRKSERFWKYFSIFYLVSNTSQTNCTKNLTTEIFTLLTDQ